MDGFKLKVGNAALYDSGRSSCACRKLSYFVIGSGIELGDGGTKIAFPGRVPPIQFWNCLNSPGNFVLPAPVDNKMLCISRMKTLNLAVPKNKACNSKLEFYIMHPMQHCAVLGHHFYSRNSCFRQVIPYRLMKPPRIPRRILRPSRRRI